MKGEGVIYKPGIGEPERIEFDGAPDLDAIRAAIGGGWLEHVKHLTRLPDGRHCVAFCDEEGKLKEMPVNDAATAIWHAQLVAFFGNGAYDKLRGPVLCIVGDDDFIAAL